MDVLIGVTFYANQTESPCDFDQCADYDSRDHSEDIGTSDSDSDSTSITYVSEQAQPLQLDEMPSVADVESLHKEQCPEQYAALPKIADLEFDDWQNGRAQKHLHVSAIRTPFDSVGCIVYAFIYGNNSNRIGLTQGKNNKPLALKDADDVSLVEPFRSICWSNRLDFEQGLIVAVQWLGRAMIKQRASTHIETTNGSNIRNPEVSVFENDSTARKRSLPPGREPGQADAVKSEYYNVTQTLQQSHSVDAARTQL